LIAFDQFFEGCGTAHSFLSTLIGAQLLTNFLSTTRLKRSGRVHMWSRRIIYTFLEEKRPPGNRCFRRLFSAHFLGATCSASSVKELSTKPGFFKFGLRQREIRVFVANEESQPARTKYSLLGGEEVEPLAAPLRRRRALKIPLPLPSIPGPKSSKCLCRVSALKCLCRVVCPL